MLVLKLVNVIIILLCLGGLLWFVRNKVKKYGQSFVRSTGAIEVVDDGLQIGINQKISVIRVGDELFLHSFGSSGVAFQPLKAKELIDRGEKWEENFKIEEEENKIDFSKVVKAVKEKGERDE